MREMLTVEYDVRQLRKVALMLGGITALCLYGVVSAGFCEGVRWQISALAQSRRGWVSAILVFPCLWLTVSVLRRIVSPDKRALIADATGISVRSLSRTRHFDWDEIEDVKLRQLSVGGAQTTLMVKGGNNRTSRISATNVVGGVDALESWLSQATELLGNRRA